MYKHGGHGNAFCASMRCKALRLSNCHTGLKSLVVSRYEWSENIAIHLHSSIMSAAAMPAFGGCGPQDRYGFKVHHVVAVHVHSVQT